MHVAAPSAAMAVLLAAVAGYVDAVAYLSLGHVLVAHLSGDTAQIAVRAGHGAWHEAAGEGAAIAGFVAGLVAGRAVSDATRGRVRRGRFAPVLGLELALLVVTSLLGVHLRVVGIALLAAAMGAQNATLRHAAGHDVRTTFVTGMVVTFVDELFDWLRRRPAEDADAPFPALHAGVWLAFGAGAFLSAASGAHIWPAAGAILIIIAWDVSMGIHA